MNMPADSFESPLTLAACGGHVELAALLIERGANLEEVNDEGYTPLMEAAREGHEEMVALLLGQGEHNWHMPKCIFLGVFWSFLARLFALSGYGENMDFYFGKIKTLTGRISKLFSVLLSIFYSGLCPGDSKLKIFALTFSSPLLQIIVLILVSK